MSERFTVHTNRRYESSTGVRFNYTWISLEMSKQEAERYVAHQNRFPGGLESIEIKEV